MENLSYKAKKLVILVAVGGVLMSVLVGFAAIGAANGIQNLAKSTVGEPNFSVIWAIFLLYLTGIMDIFIAFGGIIGTGFWLLRRLK